MIGDGVLVKAGSGRESIKKEKESNNSGGWVGIEIRFQRGCLLVLGNSGGREDCNGRNFMNNRNWYFEVGSNTWDYFFRWNGVIHSCAQ